MGRTASPRAGALALCSAGLEKEPRVGPEYRTEGTMTAISATTYLRGRAHNGKQHAKRSESLLGAPRHLPKVRSGEVTGDRVGVMHGDEKPEGGSGRPPPAVVWHPWSKQGRMELSRLRTHSALQ